MNLRRWLLFSGHLEERGAFLYRPNGRGAQMGVVKGRRTKAIRFLGQRYSRLARRSSEASVGRPQSLEPVRPTFFSGECGMQFMTQWLCNLSIVPKTAIFRWQDISANRGALKLLQTRNSPPTGYANRGRRSGIFLASPICPWWCVVVRTQAGLETHIGSALRERH